MEFYSGDYIALHFDSSADSAELVMVHETGQLRYSALGEREYGGFRFEFNQAISHGEYHLFLKETTDGKRKTTVKDKVTVHPDMSEYEDLRSPTKRILDALIDTMLGRASDGVLERTVDGVTLKYASPEQIRKLVDIYQQRYDSEQGIINLPGTVVTRSVR